MKRVTVETSAGTFHALDSGGQGSPLVFLHGFPDHPPTAAPFLAELSARGHRVLAPWLRGYAPSPVEGPFDLDTLVADVAAIIARWSPDRPVAVIGHDWGAVITYGLCQAAPERVARAVTLAIPHPLTFVRQLRSPAQLRASWYMGLFQMPGAGRIVAAREFRLIDRLWRRWSPKLTLPHAQRAELRACLAASMPAPLGYYRAAARAGTKRLRRLGRPIATPLLALHGADDGCVLPPTFDDRHRFTGEYERQTLPDVGHFLHVEDPASVAERASAWLS